ncbi:hypothetical protein K438DRAFT_1981953 [Mycena galopus ATCC 62051]|nr:hypothetical protein K438DRAFT_1981953 [Mycena galopus ATCC 62051]
MRPRARARANTNTNTIPPATTPYTALGPIPLRMPHAHPSYEWDSESTDEERGPPHAHTSISYPHPGTGMPYPTQGHGHAAAGGMARLAIGEGVNVVLICGGYFFEGAGKVDRGKEGREWGRGGRAGFLLGRWVSRGEAVLSCVSAPIGSGQWAVGGGEEGVWGGWGSARRYRFGASRNRGVGMGDASVVSACVSPFWVWVWADGGGPSGASVFPAMRRLRWGSRPSRIDGLPLPPTSPSTSTSTSHRSAVVAYSALARHMSSHQRTQGYVPGAWGYSLPPTVPAFVVPPEDQQQPNQNLAGVGASAWGQQAALGAARAAATAPPTSAVGYSTPFAPPAPADPRGRSREHSERGEKAREEKTRRNGGRVRLRTVLLPQVTLSRFLAIASGNTARNRETCGLLLGREVVRGSADSAAVAPSSRMRYVVETLLIPRQHATSDTCTMDEEEGVLGFTEERGPITLGWVNPHAPLAIMLHVLGHLHTHASFQCMLPESFAVVCAPKSDPSFGIFRLTDPPGLQTVLKCTAKQVFHPHPDVPIYTDADKGHMQMRDAALEIVDLR